MSSQNLKNVSAGGDVILGNKETHQYNINHIIINSSDYNELLADINDLEDDINNSSSEEVKSKKREKLTDKLKKLELLKEHITSLYDTFNKIPLNTDRLKKARDYFYDGKFKEADTLLKADDIFSEIDSLRNLKRSKEKEINEINESLKVKSNEFLIKAHIKSLLFGVNSIEDSIFFFEKAIETYRTPTALREYAEFLQKMYLHNSENSTIISLYEESLLLYQVEEEKDLNIIANIHLNLNTAYNIDKEIDKAIKNGEKAIFTLKKLSSEDDINNLSLIAKVSNNLATSYTDCKEFEKAREKFEESYIIRKKLCSINKDYEREFAITLGNYALFLAYTGEKDNALIKFIETKELQKNLIAYDEKNINLNSELSSTLLNLGRFYLSVNNIDESINVFEEYLVIRRRLAELYPNVFLPYLVSALIEVSSIYCYLKPNKNKLIDLTNEAITILNLIFVDKEFHEKAVNHISEMLSRLK